MQVFERACVACLIAVSAALEKTSAQRRNNARGQRSVRTGQCSLELQQVAYHHLPACVCERAHARVCMRACARATVRATACVRVRVLPRRGALEKRKPIEARKG